MEVQFPKEAIRGNRLRICEADNLAAEINLGSSKLIKKPLVNDCLTLPCFDVMYMK